MCILKYGFLDVKLGAVLTSERALAAVRRKLEKDLRDRAANRLDDERKELRTTAEESNLQGYCRRSASLKRLGQPERANLSSDLVSATKTYAYLGLRRKKKSWCTSVFFP